MGRYSTCKNNTSTIIEKNKQWTVFMHIALPKYLKEDKETTMGKMMKKRVFNSKHNVQSKLPNGAGK